MNPGRELDALVAEKVMGLRVKFATQWDGEPQPVCPELRDQYDEQGIGPFYSTDIADAWHIAERHGFMLAPRYEPGLYRRGGLPAPIGWDVYDDATAFHDDVYSEDGSERALASAETAPHAICLAALAAVGTDQ